MQDGADELETGANVNAFLATETLAYDEDAYGTAEAADFVDGVDRTKNGRRWVIKLL